MIAGETEMILHEDYEDTLYDLEAIQEEEDYDDFLFFGNKEKRQERKAARKARRTARRTSPKRIKRRAKRKSFFSKLGNAYQEIGGGAGLGSAIDALTSVPKATAVQPEIPIDFGHGMDEDDREKEASVSSLYLIGGAVLVVGVLGIVLLKNHNNR